MPHFLPQKKEKKLDIAPTDRYILRTLLGCKKMLRNKTMKAYKLKFTKFLILERIHK